MFSEIRSKIFDFFQIFSASISKWLIKKILGHSNFLSIFGPSQSYGTQYENYRRTITRYYS